MQLRVEIESLTDNWLTLVTKCLELINSRLVGHCCSACRVAMRRQSRPASVGEFSMMRCKRFTECDIVDSSNPPHWRLGAGRPTSTENLVTYEPRLKKPRSFDDESNVSVAALVTISGG